MRPRPGIFETHLLLVIHSPVTAGTGLVYARGKASGGEDVHFVVITSPQINHDVLVPEVQGVTKLLSHAGGRMYHHSPVEEHDRARVVQLVHLCEPTAPVVSGAVYDGQAI